MFLDAMVFFVMLIVPVGYCCFFDRCLVLKIEVWGLLEGLWIAAEMTFDSVEVKCDSRILVDFLNGRKFDCHDIRNILLAIVNLLVVFRWWRICHK